MGRLLLGGLVPTSFAACTRKRYAVCAISLCLYDGLAPVPFSRHVPGRDTPFMRPLSLSAWRPYTGAFLPACTRKRFAISAISLSAWWPCTGAFLPACTRKRFDISAISLPAWWPLPALFSRHVRQEICHFCDLSLCLQLTHDAARKSLRGKKKNT
jgi:hypothetical protein